MIQNIMKIKVVRNTLFVLVTLALLLSVVTPSVGAQAPAGLDRELPTPVPLDKRPTDELVINAFTAKGVDLTYVSIDETDVKSHPYSIRYIDTAETNPHKQQIVEVISQLPIYNSRGERVVVGFSRSGADWVASPNTFSLVVTNTRALLAAVGDQPGGVKHGDTVTWDPDLYVGGALYEPVSAQATRLVTDPYNENYSGNVLEWDYGVCKRQLRIIEGMVREWWVFDEDPQGEVRIDHNTVGNIILGLGTAVDAYGFAVECYVEDADTEVVPSMVGATFPVSVGGSATFYPDADPETSTVDGYIFECCYLSWDDLHDATSGSSRYTNTDYLSLYVDANNVGNKWDSLTRVFMLFDTSALDGTTVTAATLSVYGYYKQNDFTAPPELCLVEATITSNTELYVGGYDEVGTTRLATDITYAAFSTSGYNTFTLNASGIAAIDTDGVSKFALRLQKDLDDDSTWELSAIDHMSSYSADKGSGYQPKLIVTYTTTPTVVTNSASPVTSTAATLNGNITDSQGNVTSRGFDWGLDDSYGTSWTETGTFGNGTYSHSTGATLTPGVTYHYRAKAYNVNGWGLGSGVTFTTPAIAPTVTNAAASNVAAQAARLNGVLTDDGGNTTTVTYYWGETDGVTTPGNWDNAEALGTKSEGAFYVDISGLSISTTYYYRAYASNAQGSDWADATGNFTTKLAVLAPTNFVAIPSLTAGRIDLNWTPGTGSTQTHVRYQSGSYPTSISEGTQACLTMMNSCYLEDQDPGATLYFSAFGVSGNLTSTGYATAMATTIAGEASEEWSDTSMPSKWYQTPDPASLSSLEPFYSMGVDFADTIDMPDATFFVIADLVFCAIMAFIMLALSRSFFVALATLALLILLGVVIGILSLWFIFPVLIGGIAVLAGKGRPV